MKGLAHDGGIEAATHPGSSAPWLRQCGRTLRFTTIIGCACAMLGGAATAHAVEGGVGVYALGYISPQAGLMPEPGTYGSYNFYSYKGSATANVSVAGQVSVPGTGLKLPAQLTGSVTTDVNSYAHLFSATHVFTEKVLGGHAGIGLLVPYISADLDARGSGVLSLTGPGGSTFAIPLNGQASASDSGMGDITASGLLGWHHGRVHTMAILNVYAPTGDYDRNRALNVGKNRWAIEPMASVTYLNEARGLEISSAAGITFNRKNPDTDYKSGDEFHLDLSVIQHFSERLYAGLTTYAYDQLTGDSGSGAPADGYKGRVYSWGGTFGGTIPLGQKQKLFVNARYYKESGARNRTEGDAFFISASMKF